MFWRGVTFLEGASSVMVGYLQCFGWVLAVEGPAVFWRGVAFFRMLLQSFGGVWHFWRALAVFWRGVAFLEDTCSVLEGVAFVEGACSVLERQEALVQHLVGHGKSRIYK